MFINYFNLIGPFSASCSRDITFNDDKSTSTDYKKQKKNNTISINLINIPIQFIVLKLILISY